MLKIDGNWIAVKYVTHVEPSTVGRYSFIWFTNGKHITVGVTPDEVAAAIRDASV